jgi:peptidoglycan hydrolase-like protein with peptidoglycan-binding domain
MIKKLILGTASVLALGIGGAALDFSANADDIPNASAGPAYDRLNAANLSKDDIRWAEFLLKDDIRWAQFKLHTIGFYDGSLDGVVGPETKRAILGFQNSNSLERTGRLDQQTADALTGDTVVGQGSSTPPKGAGAGAMKNSSGMSDFGAGQK